MGFLVSGTIYVDNSGARPFPLPNPVSSSRPHTVYPVAANILPPTEGVLTHFQIVIPHRPAFRPNRQPVMPTPPLNYGDFDSTYLPAYGAQRVQPPRRLVPDPKRHPQSEGPSIQWQIDQSIDHIAIYCSPAPRIPRIPLDRQPNQTRTGDPHPFTQRDVDELYAAIIQHHTRPRRPEADRQRTGSVLTRDSEQDDWYVSWAGQTIRPAAPPQRRGTSALMQQLLESEPGFEYILTQQVRPPVALVPKPIIVNAAPPWMSMISIAVPGPFYVVAGQVSPAAGAVMGEVRAAGED